MAQDLKAALLKLVDDGKLGEARTLLEELHNEHGITDSAYDELSGYLLGGQTVHRQWEDALMLAHSTRCPDEKEVRIGLLTGTMSFLPD